jgi:alpha-tubulin suppressor-like RCC1 family protein
MGSLIAAWPAVALLLLLPHASSRAQCHLGVNSFGSHSLLLHPSGIVFSWGYNNSGQLGNGTDIQVGAPVNVVKGEYPGNALLGDNPANPVTGVASLYRHSLALVADGTVYAWGANNFGELGDDSLGNHFTPTHVMKGEYDGTAYLGDNPANRIVQVAGGVNYSAVLAADGSVYGFGRNDYGQLGNGTKENSLLPARVKKGEYNGTAFLGDNPANRVIAIAGGAEGHMLALTADGSVYSWGRNNLGQLGTGDTIGSATPVRVRKGAYDGTMFLGDNPANPVVAVAAGGNSIQPAIGNCSAALLKDGTIVMWGGNVIKLLGDGTNVDRLEPIRVLKGAYPGTAYLGDDPANPVRSISIGGYESAALTADGSLYTWGNNAFGQLGNNDRASTGFPVRVLKGEYNGTTYLGDNQGWKITEITAAERDVIAIVNGYKLYGWGDNHRRQIVDSTIFDSQLPVLFADFSPPSIDLEYFRVELMEEAYAHLTWRTRAEEQSISFEIERKLPAGDWQQIATRPAGGGTTGPVDYFYDDDLTAIAKSGDIVWYRLKHIAADNSVRYFDSVSVEYIAAGVEANTDAAPYLAQNSPNPFSETTTIQYRLASRGHVRLDICDLSGRTIASLVDEEEGAGTYRIPFGGSNLAAGIYCYRLRVGEFSENRMMVYVP